MKIVTTPMCEEVLNLAGITGYDVSSKPDSTDADIAIVLSETDTIMKSIKVKLNTFKQIKTSIEMLRDMFVTDTDDYNFPTTNYKRNNELVNKNIKIKVYSNFLMDIIDDLGFNIVQTGHDYLVYPDYIRNELADEIITMGDMVVEIPTHKNAPKNPIKRAEMRYKLLEKKLCTKP
jgi:segregation and condensation protein B